MVNELHSKTTCISTTPIAHTHSIECIRTFTYYVCTAVMASACIVHKMTVGPLSIYRIAAAQDTLDALYSRVHAKYHFVYSDHHVEVFTHH